MAKQDNATATVENNEVKDSQATEITQLDENSLKEFKQTQFASEDEAAREYQTHTSLAGKSLTLNIPIGSDNKPMKYRKVSGEEGRSFAALWTEKDKGGVERTRATHLTGGELDKLTRNAKVGPKVDHENYDEAIGSYQVRAQFAQGSGEVIG